MGIINNIKKLFAKKELPKQETKKIEVRDNYYYIPKNQFIPNSNLLIDLSPFGTTCYNLNRFLEVIENDDQFKSTLDSLINKITALDYEIITYNNVDKRIFKFIKNMFDNINISSFLKQALYYQLICGFVPVEIKYDVDDKGNQIIKDFEIHNPNLFFYDNNKDLFYYQIQTNNKYNLTKDYYYQFDVLKHRGDNLNIYGKSEIGYAGYKLYFIRDVMLKDFAVVTERIANPSVFATLNTDNMGENEKAKFLEEFKTNTLVSIADSKNVGVILNKDERLEYLQYDSNNVVNLAEHLNLINNAISKLILNSTMTQENNTGIGSYAQSEVMENTTQAKIESICKEIEDFFNNIIQKVIELNFGKDDYENIFFEMKYRRKIVDKEEFERVKWCIENGIEIDKDWFYERFNIPKPKKNAELINKPEKEMEVIDGSESIIDDTNDQE